MSRRHLLNLTTGGVIALLIGAILFAFSAGRGDDQEARAALAIDQQELIHEMALDAAELAAADDLPSVNRARTTLGEDIYRFDVNLAALLDGGTATDHAGRSMRLDASRGEARQALSTAAEVWLRIGLPLSDLAAGSFSAYSASGRQAIAGFESGTAELAQHLGAAANIVSTSDSRRGGLVGSARGLSIFLALVLAGLIVLRRRGDFSDEAPVAAAADASAVAPAMATPVATAIPVPLAPPPTPQPYTAPVDLDNLSASVDRMGVDMQIISTSTDKMQMAIDSVGHALQGMLYSLNEMAKDTEDGERIVRGSNSAAAYTAEVAAALVESVREMSRVVGNVTELAKRTRQTASTLDVEAAGSERTGKGFNLAVANEVRGLSAKTATSAASIEDTVSDMLAKTREYEEAIGQIIKHITNINRVSENLGVIMLDPPTPDIVPAPTPPTGSPEPAAAPVPGVLDDTAGAEEFAAETAAAINEAASVLEESPAPAAEAAPEAPAPEAPPETFTMEEPAATEEPVAPAPESAAEEPEQNPAVFVLSRALEEDDAPAEATEPVAEVEEPVDAVEPEPAPEPVVEAPVAAAPEPAPEPEPAPAPPAEEPVAEVSDDSDELAVSDGDSPNIFILNPPDGAESEAEKVPAGDD